MIVLTPEQKIAYDRFITARNKMGIVRVKGFSKTKWIPQRDSLATVDIVGQNHPVYVQNDDWLEYKEASLAWWAIEPDFRKAERMSAIRGDYGVSDSWDEGSVRMRDTFSTMQGEEWMKVDGSLGRAIPVDVYDKDGNMIRIEFSDGEGEHILDAVWDESDEQTSKNRTSFRKWAYNFMRNKGYEVFK